MLIVISVIPSNDKSALVIASTLELFVLSLIEAYEKYIFC